MKIQAFLLKWKGVLLSLILSLVFIPFGFELLFKLIKWVVSLFSVDLLVTPYAGEILLIINGLLICAITCLFVARLTALWHIPLFLLAGVISSLFSSTHIISVNVARRVFEMEGALTSAQVSVAMAISLALSIALAIYLKRNADDINHKIDSTIKSLRGEMNQIQGDLNTNSNL